MTSHATDGPTSPAAAGVGASDGLAGAPVDTGRLAPDRMATCARPAELHARLRDDGVHERGGAWVVARPPDVRDALRCPALTVGAAEPPTGEARRLRSRMARFSDGARHAERRSLAERVLPVATGLDAVSARRTTAALDGRGGTVDVMPLARAVPVEALAEALGVPSGRIADVAALVGRLCDALAPSLVTPPVGPEDADAAARDLTTLLGGTGDGEQVAALAGLLFQARDATAALIGAAVLADDGASDPADVVDRALRHDAPVQCTRRTAAEDVVLGGTPIPRGAPVWVVLAAEPGHPSRPATFGGGPHGCPGAAHATAVAVGVLTALRTRGLRPVPGQRVEHEPRPNLRHPVRVLVQRSP